MKNADVMVIGAGAAGLMAAYELSKAGQQVIILEARNRAGGRIHTLDDTYHTELGAEFVHGDLPVTLQLLKEAGIEVIPATAEMCFHRDGKFLSDYQQMDDWDVLMEKLSELKNDVSIGDFLQQEFSEDNYSALRKYVTKYVEGYDTADIFLASAFALRREWQNEDDNAQHRVKGGYGQLIDYLVNASEKHGAQLILNSTAKNIHWTHGQVEVITDDGESYKAVKLVIALPLGVLKAAASEQGVIHISPSVPSYQEAIAQIGFGAIFKLLFEFKTAFWVDKVTNGVDLKDTIFILSDEEVPTWWTQHPSSSNLLTGWLGGPSAEQKKDLPDEELLQRGLQSLSNIFKLSPSALKDELVSWKVINWTTDPFTRGSYAYDMIASAEARKVLNTPVNYALYFAGEYLYDGPAMGTVEAALTSGMETAKKIVD